MKLGIEDIINKHNGKIGMCVATGPSLKPYLNIVDLLSNNNKDEYCFFSVNEFDTMFSLKADYRVVANSSFNLLSTACGIINNNPGTKLLYADSVDTTNPVTVEESLLTVDYLSYDQRHYKGKHCDVKSACCDNIVEGRLTIQEELQKYCDHHKHYGYGHTVALHMLAFTILSGCRSIYIFGVDLNYKNGSYVDGKSKNDDTFDPYLGEIIYDFKTIRNMAKNIGVEIYSSTKDSPINNVFEYKEFLPTAVLLAAVVLLYKAELPKAVLLAPVVLVTKAK